MQNIFQQNALAESKRCYKLYPGSSNLETMISLFFKARDLFQEQRGEAFQQEDVRLGQEEIQNKMRKSEKLLPAAHFEGKLVQDFLAVLCAGISGNNRAFEKPLEKLQETVKTFSANNDDKVLLQDMPNLVEKIVGETSLERDFVTFLLAFILSSLYCAPLEQFLRDLDTVLWEESFCPVCGETPHYGFLREESGEKLLECWFCGTSWRYPRVKCPYCGVKDQEKLGFFTVEENEVCRVHFCRQCQKYHKVFDCRKLAETDGLFILHHLHTLHFEWLAQKEGFLTGSGLKWIEEKDDESAH